MQGKSPLDFDKNPPDIDIVFHPMMMMMMLMLMLMPMLMLMLMMMMMMMMMIVLLQHILVQFRMQRALSRHLTVMVSGVPLLQMMMRKRMMAGMMQNSQLIPYVRKPCCCP